ncbi:MAG: DUF58 domain-containing protein [Pseudomonadales bacterium]|nr:DUF58 domain-containing protein [Pseudomonadales bacterium]
MTRTLGTLGLFLTTLLTTLRERFPLTLQGFAVLVLALAALRFFAFAQMDLVVFALAVCAITIVCAALLLVLIAGLVLRQRQRRTPSPGNEGNARNGIQAEAGYVNETGFSWPALSWIPLVSLSWEIIHPDAIETRNRLSPHDNRWEEQILAHRRCYSPLIIRRYTLTDVLGFCRFSWRISTQQTVMVLPQKAQLQKLPFLRSLTAEDGLPSPSGNPEGDRMEIRPYAPGDSVRNIMWKVYARNRHLNVRLAERSVHHSNRTLAYQLSGPDDEAAAAVARVAIETGALGEEWVFGADLCAEPTSNPVTAVSMTARSRILDGALDSSYGNIGHGNIGPRNIGHGNTGAYGLDRFLQQQQQQGGLNCIIFAGTNATAWLGALRQTVARYPGRYTVVLATDGLTDEYRQPLWQRLLYTAQTRSGQNPGVAAVASLLTQLGQFVESTVLVDRQSGQTYDHRLKKINA